MKEILQSFFTVFVPLYFLIFGQVQAQSIVTGRVVSEGDGDPLPGVNILVKDSNKGTASDIDGRYSLEVDADDILVFSYIGFTAQEVRVNGRSVIDVALVLDVSQLQEIVVVGYGTQRKRDVTGSISSIDGTDIAEQPVPNALNALQGKASGVLVTNSGEAGAAPTIRIRGVGSINGVAPLFIVDGIFTDNIDFVNPADIESVEVLKDASSLAVFGVQGANGAIIITTKKAEKGQTTVNVNSYAGFQRVNERIGLTNAAEFQTLYNEQLANLGGPAFDFSQYGNSDTDWQDEILRTGFISNNSISFRSGTENNQASFSLSYLKQDGVQKYDEYTRYTARLRDELTINDHLKVGADINGYRWERNPTRIGITNALWAAPVVEPTDEEGNWNPTPTIQRAQVANPVALTEIFDRRTISEGFRFVASGWVEVKFLKNFTWKSTAYGDWGFNEERAFQPIFEIGTGDERAQFNDVTSVRQEMVRFTTYQTDHILTFNKTFGDHDLTAVGGIISRYASKGLTIEATRQTTSPINIPDDEDFWYLSIGDDNTSQRILTPNENLPSEESFLSFLARLNYSYQNKYLLNLTYRRDGTSKFSPNERWGNFGSVGVGWVISEEGFMKDIPLVDFLKIKGSWGALGNDKVGNYRFFPVLSNAESAVFGENVFTSVAPSYLANPNLKWETVKGIDVGFEILLLDERLSADFAYYNRESQDLLVLVDLPSGSPAPNLLTNLGSIVNKGIELSANWEENLTPDVRYRIGGNFTTVDNEVTSIGDDITFQIVRQNSVTEVGQTVGSFFGLVQEGIFQTAEEIAASPQAGMAEPGDIRFKDVDGDGVFNAEKDRTFIGSPIPEVIYALSFGISYKNFDLDIEMQGVAGNDIYRERSRSRFAILNYEEERLGRWVGPGTSNTEPIMDDTRNNNFLHSTYFMDPGDYFRIRNISLGYNLSSAILSKLNMTSAKVYINAQNPLTFHKARNYSPEVSGGTPIRSGIDDGVYPVPATYTLGVNLNF
ncbi:TonB-dependent receptor [Fulvivirga sp. M361]|uniref:SusC/RagA family TonB-linked outer membrane protein n=1 Tax=Fulvivirga sp. M361 TaxID=2594266 RepID=UPI00117A6482|nr:TonB-dependent receptor [Fulvivirga sp. M361]TRX58456.1 TonB-dependent receptor [Fulvivirga sp. M361]